MVFSFVIIYEEYLKNTPIRMRDEDGPHEERVDVLR